ncbi:MAG: pilus assembly protein PilP [Pseudomonadota bacterium]
MKKTRLKLLSILSVLSLAFFLSACDDKPSVQKETKPFVVQKNIMPPAPAAESAKPVPSIIEKKSDIPAKVLIPEELKSEELKSEELKPENLKIDTTDKVDQPDKIDKTDISVQKETIDSGPLSKALTTLEPNDTQKTEHYDAEGKIDPFKPLIQDKTEESIVVNDNKPKRILTPLEKIDLSQIRLVAVILMKNKKIAMVEEGSGKGYEVGIGTYIGKNQGRISEILSSSIVVKELIKDYRGRLKEQKQEIKLHKKSDEE